MYKKLFTPAEANHLLPYVRQAVVQILAKAQEIRKTAQLEMTIGRQAHLEGLESEMRHLISDLEGHGCFYKDWNFEVGLVDFPAKFDDQVVFLCWRSDEEEVTWYHPLDQGYSARSPIPPHLLNEPGSK